MCHCGSAAVTDAESKEGKKAEWIFFFSQHRQPCMCEYISAPSQPEKSPLSRISEELIVIPALFEHISSAALSVFGDFIS